MSELFNDNKIATLEAQIAALVERIEKIESATDLGALEGKIAKQIEVAVDDAFDNAAERFYYSNGVEEAIIVDLVRETIDKLVNKATLKISV